VGSLIKALVTLVQVPSRLKEELLKCKKMMESRLQAQQKKVAMYMMCSPLSLLERKCTYVAITIVFVDTATEKTGKS